MANPLYGYNTSYGGSSLSNVYSSRLSNGSLADPYIPDPSLVGSSRYLGADSLSASDSSKFSVLDRGSLFLNQSDSLRFSGSEIGGPGSFTANRISGGAGAAGGTSSLYSQTSWAGVDGLGAVDNSVAGLKRSAAEDTPISYKGFATLYHQTIMGSHSSIGQSEALFSANSLAKRQRFESTSNLPIYPQRPGEKDCAHYMSTRTCRFGDSCKFDHPIWVPEGGIPDWKEVPLIATIESLPERPGEPDCPYFLKTQRCKFGSRCKFNHPKEKVLNEFTVGNGAESALITADTSVLPERPSEPTCSYYMKTGHCKFGVNCKFHHPKEMQMASGGQDPGSEEQNESAAKDGEVATEDAKPVKSFVPFTPALLHNSKGLPIRPGEADCPFYLKTGSCKYGATCRYNHPDRHVINPPVVGALGHALMTSPATNLPIGVINSAASILPNIDPRLTHTALGLGPTIYPQRPGQTECDFYMKTGECKFGERCKFHHPIDRSAPTAKQVQQNVKLTLAGLPRREGAVICAYYMKTGTCKYGATCRFDHPPPGEVIAMAKAHGMSGVEEREAEIADAEAAAAVADAAEQL